jgi:vacuolar iron transporter family protein
MSHPDMTYVMPRRVVLCEPSPVEHEHSPEAIRRRLEIGHRPSYVRDWIYGGIDGAVTTFAIVSGIVGGGVPRSAILILGFANVLADGFSMAASNYSGTRSEHDEREHLAAVERRHIDEDPEGEREEIRQIFAGKGIDGQDLERVVAAVTADESRWVHMMLTHEYGLAAELRRPMKAALATFTAFAVCGVIPLLPYVAGLEDAFPASIALTCAVFFGVGAAKSAFALTPWWRSGLETLGIGGAAASLAYGAGALLDWAV